MNKSILWLIGLLFVTSLSIVSCSETDGTEDPYANWEERNQRYIDSIATADEPSGSLDTRNKEELHQLFFDLRDKLGQTFVIVTHDENLARLTDRTIHMVDGRISLKI